MVVHRYRVIGAVQGVGFRPFIYRLATKYQLKGWVLNDSEGVLIEVEGNKNILDDFANEIIINAPNLAKVDSVEKNHTKTKPGSFKNFEIKDSVKQEYSSTIIYPDTYVCNDCLAELFDESNKRFKYPFINCTNCGPRYSIIQDIPYDREKTTMSSFRMCNECQSEYGDVANRRYHAQPNACPICGPILALTDSNGVTIKSSDIIKFCIDKLKEGKIIGIKSIGGFHLAVDAQNDLAINELRKRKKRDTRPFALMAKDILTAKKYAFLSELEKVVMYSKERPVVLVRKKRNRLPESIAPKNPNYGLMLPSAPLHHLLLADRDLPVIVMTSANISGRPIVYKNEDALIELKNIADYFVLNDREIYTRVDDSIVRCISNKKLLTPLILPIRRSRGIAPYPVKLNNKLHRILALGSELKNTIAVSKGYHVFVSQHIGDLKNDCTYNAHTECSAHLKNLFEIEPEIIACDLHPGFRSTIDALNQHELQVIKIQHHHAHMASCMGENNLKSPVIGVIFDGTGYGSDGTIWGGEFLVGDYTKFSRIGSIRSFNLLGGDKAVLEPYRIAIDLMIQVFGKDFINYDLAFLKDVSEEQLRVYYIMSTKNIHSPVTSSMGRLFDGISALLNICPKVEYEAQAAIELESLLERDLKLAPPFQYQITDHNNILEIDYRDIIINIISCLNLHKNSINYISRRFHSTIVDMIVKMCTKIRALHNINDVVLSGGVFMNEFILVNSIYMLNKNKFNVYSHSRVPPNDGGLCLGQVMIADAMMKNNR
jgi:hydrogenase maturation protein HypF